MDPTYESKITTYVNEQNAKLKTMNNDALESMSENFSPDQIVETSGLTAEEVVDSFRLSLITEALAEYASTSENGFLSLVPSRVLSNAISHVKGGFGLVGDIILEQLGLSASEPDMPKDFNESLQF